MDSVYDAAKKHADELKAELTTLQTFLDLHDHFSERFGLTPTEATPEAAAAVADHEAPTVDSHLEETPVHAEAADDEPAPEMEAEEAKASESEGSESEASSEPQSSELEASGPEAFASEAGDHVEAHNAEADTDSDDEPKVIAATEGVLVVANAEGEAEAPLGPAPTLQSVAEKLAATMNASHPSIVESVR